MNQSTSTIQALVRKSMLNISNTAAGILDGDILGSPNEEDIGTPVYETLLHELTVFQNNVDIEFIYAVRQDGEDHFVFIMDPDPVEPAKYGEAVVVTNALRQAAKGIATVDDAPMEDRWGDFYSSYSPVFDSDGNIAGIVGVDFNSEWYDKQIQEHTLSIGIISLLSIFAGVVIVLLITNGVRKRFQLLRRELSILSKDIDMLKEEIVSNPGYSVIITNKSSDEKPDTLDSGSKDEIGELNDKIHLMHWELKRYLDYVHAKSYTDALTRIRNTTSYQERRDLLDEKIKNQTANFFLTVFDINHLKEINDRHGHTIGDQIIRDAARCIANIFGIEQTFRIGGDEFLVISDEATEDIIQKNLTRLDAVLDELRAKKAEGEPLLSISYGSATYQAEQDHSFQEVFIRADETMYQNKRNYHRQTITTIE